MKRHQAILKPLCESVLLYFPVVYKSCCMYDVFTVTEQLLSTGRSIQFHKPQHLFELSDFLIPNT